MKLTMLRTVLGMLVAALLAGCGGGNLTATVSTQSPPAAATELAQATQADQPTPYPAITDQTTSQAAEASLPTPYPAVTDQPTPQTALACTSPATLTPALTEGPYFKAGSPERTSLLDAGMPGTKLTITGYVLTPDCQPIAGAVLDFWQADSQGNYDNSGFTLRGHQFTDQSGYYQLETVVPGLYPGRTEHIHVKVQATGGPVLTTQLYFPDQAANQTDSIFDTSLVLPVQAASDGLTATFNFVVNPN